jgi:3-phenylpropionate/trans-cinnamate dioxygenase ferredoxin subunit
MTWLPACAESDLAEETARRVEFGTLPICLARSEGSFFALYDECSHAEVPLSEGEVEEGFVECWLHGSMFDMSSGKPNGLPATEPVRTYPVEVREGTIYVDVPAG